MSLISLQSASFSFGREQILSQVNLVVLPGVKYALVGDNGAGKTTLLSVLAGELPLQGGRREVAGGVHIQLLRQETTLDPKMADTRTAYECVAGVAFSRELALEAELASLAQALTAARAGEVPSVERVPLEELVQRQGRLQNEFERLDGYTLRARLEATLRGVGLEPETWELPLEQLSGGERRRAALAAVLLSRAEVLLLDEPTNHLDLESCEWLEDFLCRHPGAAILVSHDRQFLDRVAARTFFLQNARLVPYNGSYSYFEKAWRKQRAQQLAVYLRQQEKIQRTEEFIRRTIAGQKTRQAQSRRKQLARLERVERPEPPPGDFQMTLKPRRRSGRLALEASGLTKVYGGRPLFQGLDVLVSRGDRIGIIGPNGCGKSTLLKVLAGGVIPEQGAVLRGHNVDLGLYDQQLRNVSDHSTVLEEMASVDPTATVGEVRSFLGAFGFGEDLVDRRVKSLSGGERSRLSLMRLIKEGHNTLLLDEPTNHLDVRSRESLEDALKGYEGTMVVVSHDRRFLDKIINRLWVFSAEAPEGGLFQYLGNYSDYCHRRTASRGGEPSSRMPGEQQAATDGQLKQRSSGESKKPGPLSKNEQARRRAWIAEAEQEIAQLEAERARVLTSMADLAISASERLALGRRSAEIETLLAEKVRRWEKWSLELDESQEGS
jgi:ATP-binding cassette subfamily F protein 3